MRIKEKQLIGPRNKGRKLITDAIIGTTNFSTQSSAEFIWSNLGN